MPLLFTQANTYSLVDCGAGLAVDVLNPVLLVRPKLTVCTKVAPTVMPARATAAVARVLDFMTRILRGPGRRRHRGGQVCR